MRLVAGRSVRPPLSNGLGRTEWSLLSCSSTFLLTRSPAPPGSTLHAPGHIWTKFLTAWNAAPGGAAGCRNCPRTLPHPSSISQHSLGTHTNTRPLAPLAPVQSSKGKRQNSEEALTMKEGRCSGSACLMLCRGRGGGGVAVGRNATPKKISWAHRR